jgi:anti-sigma factor RsiW
MTQHLTHEQICDFILDPPSESAPSALHLMACPQCSAELANLSGALHSFQKLSRNFAERELARRPVVLHMPRRRSVMAIPAYVAAAALFLCAVFIPLHLHHPVASVSTASPMAAVVAVPAQSTESDEALLDEINQDLSASVPSPMEPLADPTAGASSTTYTPGNTP